MFISKEKSFIHMVGEGLRETYGGLVVRELLTFVDSTNVNNSLKIACPKSKFIHFIDYKEIIAE